jgi:hypothetical protein
VEHAVGSNRTGYKEVFSHGSFGSMMPEDLLILTATITPAEGVVIARSDPKQRFADYALALSYWLSYPHAKTGRILFLENSGADLEPLKKLASEQNSLGKQVEFLSIHSCAIPDGVSYGFAEMEMLDAGISQSKLASRSTRLIKLTGRLTFPGLGRLLDWVPDDLQIAADCRIRGATMFASSQLIIVSKEFYEAHLRGVCYELTAESPYIEELLFDKLIKFRRKEGVILRWPFNVDPVGVTGHTNRAYRSPSRVLAAAARGIVRKFAPTWWV